jgi:hypothetical protein
MALKLFDQLREHLRNSPKSLYRISKESGVDPNRLYAFVNHGERLAGTTVEKLCEALGLELVPRRETGRDQGRKS